MKLKKELNKAKRTYIHRSSKGKFEALNLVEAKFKETEEEEKKMGKDPL